MEDQFTAAERAAIGKLVEEFTDADNARYRTLEPADKALAMLRRCGALADAFGLVPSAVFDAVCVTLSDRAPAA